MHGLWVSPAVLALLPPDLPVDLPGGEIVRGADGRPSGIFLDNAMTFIGASAPSSPRRVLPDCSSSSLTFPPPDTAAVIPPWTTASRMSFLRATALSMLEHGLTSVHDAALSPADVRFLRALDEQGRLPIRLYGFVGCEPTNAWCGDDEGVERYEGDRFTVRCVVPPPALLARPRSFDPGLISLFARRAAKIFSDGALGSWGAAMHEPYSGASLLLPSLRRRSRTSRSCLDRTVRHADPDRSLLRHADAPDKKGFMITEEDELEPLIGKVRQQLSLSGSFHLQSGAELTHPAVVPRSGLLRYVHLSDGSLLSLADCLPLAAPLPLLLPLAPRSSRAQGFQVNSHGIGDRANTVVLDIYERALRNLTLADGRDPDSDEELRRTQREVRLRVEHAQILVRSLLSQHCGERTCRMAKLTRRRACRRRRTSSARAASGSSPRSSRRTVRPLLLRHTPPRRGTCTDALHVFPAATSDMAYAEERLGSERIRGAYAWRSLLKCVDPLSPLGLIEPLPQEPKTVKHPSSEGSTG